ncbi:RNA ligase 2 [Brevundimonas phage vB_BpoS-Domovoi]|uniref:RNA ligase 2 n=1 Tax=Brevundimonas phage vB_BpoS-Domovoi TaxID=2948598 RepID=A0A9E7MR27_9CAUD|nr:RNA ligase 2 [Brevundimonas phage vB_BpoS-Domovoi]
MSTFAVPILAIDDVYDHPNADRLSIIRIRGYEAVAGKAEDGSHRFVKGERIIYVPEGAVVPAAHLKERGYWNEAKDIGLLAGTKGNRVKAITLRGVLSQGLVWKTEPLVGAKVKDRATGDIVAQVNPEKPALAVATAEDGSKTAVMVDFGDDVADFFGITKYDPPIPPGLDGDVFGLFEAMFNYDIENAKAFPNLFTEDDVVTVTEKLHGTFCRMTYMPGIEPREDLFGDGRVAITSKGLGADGLVFKNTAFNRQKNVYVRNMLPLVDHFVSACNQDAKGLTVHLMGEVYGAGVQDLKYGRTEDQGFAAFDVWIEKSGFLAEVEKDYACIAFGVERVPVLFEGFYDKALIEDFAKGDTTIDGAANIREGVVVTLTGEQDKRPDGNGLGGTLRPICKVVSEAYLTRKGGTELQ